METSLHRALKERYAAGGGQVEYRLGRYRIDVADGERLIEIQHGSLAALARKVADLVVAHDVLVVKPLVMRRRIVWHARRGGRAQRARWSPKRGSLIDLFDDLLYFTRVFPHPRLTLEVLPVEIEEWRCPRSGRRGQRRRGRRDWEVLDQRLTAVLEPHRLRTARDLWRLVDVRLPQPFHTGHLADALGIERWHAQQIAYCLRETGAARSVGRQGNTRLYLPADPAGTAENMAAARSSRRAA